MPKPKRQPEPPPLSRADILSDIDLHAIWKANAPEPQIIPRRQADGHYIDHTRDTYAAEFKISRTRATSKLAELVRGDNALFECGKYRIKGEKHGRLVYWPKVAGPPA